jgi:predicted MPP superfamily phosphohydrolase
MKKAIALLSAAVTLLTAACGVLSFQLFNSNKINAADKKQLSALQDTLSKLQYENEGLKKAAENTPEEHPLDKEYNDAMKNWSGVTAEGVSIIGAFGDKWKAEMEKYYQLLYDALAEDKKKWLVSSQNEWVKFTKENEELTWQTYDQINHGGTIMQIFSSNIYLERYRDRTLTLKSLYDFLNIKY